MRRLFCLLFLIASLFLLAGTASADTSVVTYLETECEVASDGSCEVELRVGISFEDGTRNFFIPVSPNARDVKVTGAEYRVERGAEYTKIVLLGSYSGTVELTVDYRLAETVTAVGSVQKFEINLLYPAWTCAIQCYGVLIHMPAPFDGFPTILSGYYGDLIDNYMEITISGGDLLAVLNPKQVLQDHEAMSLSLDLPGDYFDLRFLAGKTVKFDKLVFLVLLALGAVFWLVFIRGRIPLPRRQAMPPVGSNAGDIPFVLTDRKPDLALMLVHWATLGYLRIHRSRGGQIWLSKLIDMGNERKSYEIGIFRALFARGERCDLRSREYSRASEFSVTKTVAFWRKRVFGKSVRPVVLRLLAAAAGLVLCLACFDVLVPPKSWRWYAILPLALSGGLACWLVQGFGGCLLRRHSVRTIFFSSAAVLFLLIIGRRSGLLKLMLLCVLIQILTGLLLRCGGRRTKTGFGLATELLGYRRYLLGTPSAVFRGSMDTDPQFFYRSLPFADALQVGRIFAGSLDDVRLEPCDWLDWEGKPARSTMAFYTRYLKLMAGLRGEKEPFLLRLKQLRNRQSRTRRRTLSTGAVRRRPGDRRRPDNRSRTRSQTRARPGGTARGTDRRRP